MLQLKWVAGCAALPLIAIAILHSSSSIDAVAQQKPTSAQSATAREEASSADLETQARVVCGTACHTFPPPDILPREAWRDAFARMHFIRENREPPPGPPKDAFRGVELPPDMEQVLPYYIARAPERLAAPEPWPAPSRSPVRFTRSSLTLPDTPGGPGVSNVQLVDIDGDKRLDVLGTDMRANVVFTGLPVGGDGTLSVVADIPHPAHVSVADLDKDGRNDLLVADLGVFFPSNEKRGAAVWLRALEDGTYVAHWLDGWGRVADVRMGDFNGDGRNDLLVAAFGWRKNGEVTVVENRPAKDAQPDSFRPHVIDSRTGAIHAIPADLNRDGHMDFVTLLAQEHETVLAYINKGTKDFTFEQHVMYKTPHPNWGSSGISLVDLDKDGDLDVLYTHGDTFDDWYVKPYHGIQWLENRGTYPYTAHTLAQMPGVHRARAADIDGDGDLDIVACALVAGGSDVDENTLPAVVWLEQTKPGVFVRHTIAMGFPRHATLDVGDVDGDGDIDIVTGHFSVDKPAPAWVDVWLNQSKQPAGK